MHVQRFYWAWSFKMSVDYASLLSDYDDKGVCGLPEVREG